MTSRRWLLRGLILFSSLLLPKSFCAADCVVGTSTNFECTASSSEQTISFSSNGTDMNQSVIEWEINAESSDRQIAFRVTDLFLPLDSLDCLVIKNEFRFYRLGYCASSARAPTMQNAMKASSGRTGMDMRMLTEEPACGAEQTSKSDTITVTYTIKFQSKQSRGFVLKYRSISPEVQIRQMANYSAGHYVLMAASCLVFILLVGGVICLVRRERMREEQKREKAVRQMLGRRRKGISGISGADLSSSTPDHTDTVHTDTTSFVESLGLGSSTLSV